MHICDLPKTEYVGLATCDEGELARLLNRAVWPDKGMFFASGVVVGMLCSCRILCVSPHAPFEGLSLYARPIHSWQAARMLSDINLMQELRYEPKMWQGAQMGWEVQKGSIDGAAFVIVIAAWVPYPEEKEEFDDKLYPTEPRF